MALRLLHSSDWHLGRALHEEPLIEDQAWALDRLVELARDERPDVIVVSGDVYDRAVPPTEAVELLDDVLTRLADLSIPVVAIAGNHDSSERFSFGSRLFTSRGIHLRGSISPSVSPIELPGKGVIYALPFVDPDVVRGMEQDDAPGGHVAATEWIVNRIRSLAARQDLPTVLVSHAFVHGGLQTPDSERPVVGMASSVPAGHLRGFDYVALGHLHAPQSVAEAIRYSGSLLKYSFAESTHEKGVLLVEVERGRTSATAISLGARRDVVRLRGTLADLLSRDDLASHARDLVEVTLEDDGYVLDAKKRLQSRFAHVLSVVRLELSGQSSEGSFGQRVTVAGHDDTKLFGSFFETVTGAAPRPADLELFSDVLAEVDRAERAA